MGQGQTPPAPTGNWQDGICTQEECRTGIYPQGGCRVGFTSQEWCRTGIYPQQAPPAALTRMLGSSRECRARAMASSETRVSPLVWISSTAICERKHGQSMGASQGTPRTGQGQGTPPDKGHPRTRARVPPFPGSVPLRTSSAHIPKEKMSTAVPSAFSGTRTRTHQDGASGLDPHLETPTPSTWTLLPALPCSSLPVQDSPCPPSELPIPAPTHGRIPEGRSAGSAAPPARS